MFARSEALLVLILLLALCSSDCYAEPVEKNMVGRLLEKGEYVGDFPARDYLEQNPDPFEYPAPKHMVKFEPAHPAGEVILKFRNSKNSSRVLIQAPVLWLDPAGGSHDVTYSGGVWSVWLNAVGNELLSSLDSADVTDGVAPVQLNLVKGKLVEDPAQTWWQRTNEPVFVASIRHVVYSALDKLEPLSAKLPSEASQAQAIHLSLIFVKGLGACSDSDIVRTSEVDPGTAPVQTLAKDEWRKLTDPSHVGPSPLPLNDLMFHGPKAPFRLGPEYPWKVEFR